jgi:hypothetical protein
MNLGIAERRSGEVRMCLVRNADLGHPVPGAWTIEGSWNPRSEKPDIGARYEHKSPVQGIFHRDQRLFDDDQYFTAMTRPSDSNTTYGPAIAPPELDPV